jgi:hypothetical protein
MYQVSDSCQPGVRFTAHGADFFMHVKPGDILISNNSVFLAKATY